MLHIGPNANFSATFKRFANNFVYDHLEDEYHKNDSHNREDRSTVWQEVKLVEPELC